MKNLFIDSNIWLSLYHFTNDDLAQFEKLKALIGNDIRLFITQQVYNEVKRNRESKLKEAFKRFEIKPIQYPVFCKEYEEYKQFNADYNNLLQRYNTWKQKINLDMQNQCLPADKTIDTFFQVSGLYPCDSVIASAYTRYKIGNPPGKDNKYGDAINWECLIYYVPNNEDLYFISSDKDYRSEISDDEFNPFLADEWRLKKNSNIHFYKNLVPFLNEHFKDIQLRTEQEKQEFITKLNNSPNFESTHGIIAMMNKYSGWTESQIEDICAAVDNNNQVGWILGDDDILDFYSRLLSKVKYEELADSATKSVMESVFSICGNNQADDYSGAQAEMNEVFEELYKH